MIFTTRAFYNYFFHSVNLHAVAKYALAHGFQARWLRLWQWTTFITVHRGVSHKGVQTFILHSFKLEINHINCTESNICVFMAKGHWFTSVKTWSNPNKVVIFSSHIYWTQSSLNHVTAAEINKGMVVKDL